jgi:predicted amidophosphoribosyltransferase
MKKSVSKTEKNSQLWCPYCDEEIMNSNLPYCQACKVALFYCPGCKQPVPRRMATCPNCGARIKGFNNPDNEPLPDTPEKKEKPAK